MMMMNKILIALVLAVVMSGNAYANFITDAFKSEEELCLEAVEKGKLISEYKDPDIYDGGGDNSLKTYVYNGKKYFLHYKNYRMVCSTR